MVIRRSLGCLCPLNYWMPSEGPQLLGQALDLTGGGGTDVDLLDDRPSRTGCWINESRGQVATSNAVQADMARFSRRGRRGKDSQGGGPCSTAWDHHEPVTPCKAGAVRIPAPARAHQTIQPLACRPPPCRDPRR